MKIAISGANGFIGKHICESFSQSKSSMIYEIPRKDLLDVDKLKKDLTIFNPDYIFHLASYGNHNFQDDEESTIGTNIIKTYYLLKATQDIPYKVFINFSSSSVQLPVETFYSATKKAGEALCKAFIQKYKKPIITVRPASIFGEGEAHFRFIPTVVRNLTEGTYMKLDLKSSHSWMYVKDFVHALLTITTNSKELVGQNINISYGKEWSNIAIVREIEKISGKKLIFEEVKNMRGYDSKSWLVENRILRSLKWTENWGLHAGLINTYKYYAEQSNKTKNT